MYREIAAHDEAGVLRHEWLNSRGAIARFDRHAIEIRVADTQECPLADLAIAAAIVGVVKALYAERWSSLAEQQTIGTGTLHRMLLGTMRDAEAVLLDGPDYLDALGFDARRAV